MGPLVFSLFVTDLPNCLTAFNEFMYADDTVSITLPRMQTSYFKCQMTSSNSFLDWSNKNDLFCHRKKTEYAIFKLNRYAT